MEKQIKQRQLIKLCQNLKNSICKPNNNNNNYLMSIDLLLTTALKDDDDLQRIISQRPSTFVKMIITALLTICDDLYLESFEITLGTLPKVDKWYEITSKDNNTINYNILKHFLLDIYLNEDGENSLDYQYYNQIDLSFKDITGNQKYNVRLCEPYTMTERGKEFIVEGMCKAFANVLPINNCLRTKFAVGSILYQNLLNILR